MGMVSESMLVESTDMMLVDGVLKIENHSYSYERIDEEWVGEMIFYLSLREKIEPRWSSADNHGCYEIHGLLM